MKHHLQNVNLSANLTYTGNYITRTNIIIVQYDGEYYQKKKDVVPEELTQYLQNSDFISWVRVKGLNDSAAIIKVVTACGLTAMTAKDILTIQGAINIEEGESELFIVLPMLYYNEKGEEKTEQVAFILGSNYLISFQESDENLFGDELLQIRGNKLKSNGKKSDFLLATLLNKIINNYSEYIVQLEDSLEDLEDQLLDINNIEDNFIVTIQERRRSMINIRKRMLPFKDQLSKLLRADKRLIREDQQQYYKDIYDQSVYILQNLESCREIMSSLVDVYLNNNDVKMNNVMKKLTVVATIFIPLTFLVGVWGMNFKFMPELNWKYGYFFSWGIMLLVGILVWWYLKKKNLF